MIRKPMIRGILACLLVTVSGPASQETEPLELVTVLEVVDGDTVHVSRAGREERLRLLNVDTEEKITGRPSRSPTKPETVFGQETASWAKALFAGLAVDGAPVRVRLRFPGGIERRDVYGRLLCHVVLPDGRDFNLLLVELGKSPYFNKYGNSLIAHEAFVRAQAEARKKELGIWNATTNRPAAPDAPMARRPYELLLPWWQARAEAIDEFRAHRAAQPDRFVTADDPAGLRAALGRVIEVFGEIDRFFEEEDGSLTVLFRAGDRTQAFRAVIGADQRDRELESFLRDSTLELRRNHLFVRGMLERGPRGFRMAAGEPSAWRPAGP